MRVNPPLSSRKLWASEWTLFHVVLTRSPSSAVGGGSPSNVSNNQKLRSRMRARVEVWICARMSATIEPPRHTPHSTMSPATYGLPFSFLTAFCSKAMWLGEIIVRPGETRPAVASGEVTRWNSINLAPSGASSLDTGGSSLLSFRDEAGAETSVRLRV
eukprot:scaffold99560_cov102-Phaeocystis_antarctica.AAC.1